MIWSACLWLCLALGCWTSEFLVQTRFQFEICTRSWARRHRVFMLELLFLLRSVQAPRLHVMIRLIYVALMSSFLSPVSSEHVCISKNHQYLPKIIPKPKTRLPFSTIFPDTVSSHFPIIIIITIYANSICRVQYVQTSNILSYLHFPPSKFSTS